MDASPGAWDLARHLRRTGGRMNDRNNATWKKGTKTLCGRWRYIWNRDRFVIQLDGRDPETGLTRQPFEVAGDSPNFAGWRLVEPES